MLPILLLLFQITKNPRLSKIQKITIHLIVREIIKNSNGTPYIYIYSIHLNIKRIHLVEGILSRIDNTKTIAKKKSSKYPPIITIRTEHPVRAHPRTRAHTQRGQIWG